MLALSVVAGVTTACSDEDERPAVKAAAAAFLTAWSDGDLDKAAARTDTPAAANPFLAEVTESLAVTKVRAEAGRVPQPTDGRARVPYTVTLTLRGLGDWSYTASPADAPVSATVTRVGGWSGGRRPSCTPSSPRRPGSAGAVPSRRGPRSWTATARR